MSYYRTPEHRAASAARCRRYQPWKHSTGPKTAEGKAKVSQNPYKGGWREVLRDLANALREQEKVIESFER